MFIKKLIIIFVCILFISVANQDFLNANINNDLDNLYENKQAELPTWYLENFWKYDMDFVFTVKSLSGGHNLLKVNGCISNMFATVIETISIGSDELYKLELDGDIVGNIEVPIIGDLAQIRGDFGGYAFVDVDSLGMKEFVFNVDGEVRFLGFWHSLLFDMSMTFDPCFDFFGFPIYENKEDWYVDIKDATLDADVFIDILGGYSTSYSESTSFLDIMSYKDFEVMNGYDCFLIGGDWGDPSKLWYAPEAGFLVKVVESIFFINENKGYLIQADFNLDLIETNYVADNFPPEKPEIVHGQKEGETGELYTFSTSTKDRENDNIYYYFDWGDGEESGWIGPYPSGAIVNASHIWADKGIYNIRVKAKDTTGIESEWSDPFSIIIKGNAYVDIIIHRINKIDEIDYSPIGSNEPEWYYEVLIEQSITSAQRFHNTDDGTYNGEWNSKANWQPDKKHSFEVTNKEVIIQIKLMDYDCIFEGGKDDLADISGSDYPDTSGRKDSTEYKRGAIYHGTYNLVNNELNSFSQDPWDYSDYIIEENGYYITRGDFPPDNSTDYKDGPFCDENDAKVMFKLDNDYKIPVVTAEVNEELTLRPTKEIQFFGRVIEGIPSYSWYWDFGDDSSSNIQNPKHIYDKPGEYLVELTVTDSFGEKDTDTLFLEVINSDPVLTNDKVEWTGRGRLDDTFTFSVHYRDPDGDSPTVQNLVINGKEKTLQGSGSNSIYSLSLKGREIGKGQHTYYFHFEDGYDGVTKTEPKNFRTRSYINFYRYSIVERLIEFLKSLFKVYI